MSYLDLIKQRRSVYALSDALPISREALTALVRAVAVETPSAFNMQSAHAVILYGDAHRRLWQITTDALRQKVPAEKFAPTQAKMEMFAAGAGSILFFEDDTVVESFKEQFPSYAASFDMFAAHGLGILQGNVWNALAEQKVGASLQHYNPLIDDAVRREWKIPAGWRLVSEMVFGGIAAPAEAKEKLPGEQRVLVFD